MSQPTTAPLLAGLQAAAKVRGKLPTSQPVLATEADCIESDLALLRWKQSGGPVREHDERAVAIEQGSRRFS
jgi:hypothetical protein